MNYILFETEIDRGNLLPFTFTRPVSEIRCGILTLTDKWKRYLEGPLTFKTQSYLQTKFKMEASSSNIMLNGTVFPNSALVTEINSLQLNEALYWKEILVAAHVNGTDELTATKRIDSSVKELIKLNFTYDIFAKTYIF